MFKKASFSVKKLLSCIPTPSFSLLDIVFIPKGQIHKTSYDDVHSRLLINCSGEYLKNADFSEAFVYRNENYSQEILDLFMLGKKE